MTLNVEYIYASLAASQSRHMSFEHSSATGVTFFLSFNFKYLQQGIWRHQNIDARLEVNVV